MGLWNFLKNLFGLNRRQPVKPQEELPDMRVFRPYTSIDIEKVDLSKYFGSENAEEFGFREAGNRGGDYLGFRLHLNRIYSWYYEERRTITRNYNQEASAKIDELNAENTKTQKRIDYILEGKITAENSSTGIDGNTEMKEETIPYKTKKIKELKEEIRDIEENPKQSKYVEDYDDTKNHKLMFAISLTGIIVTVSFLWIFYSSVIYSALWRGFKLSKNIFFESILYPRSIEEAFEKSLIIGLAVCILPFLFTLLAFLFDYLYSNGRKIAGTFFLLFAFTIDCILAYRITERIYQVTHTSFTGVAEYNVGLAAKDINFWLVILLGFGVYLFLGAVYHVFSESKSALNKVKRAIKKRKDTITQIENEINNLKSEANTLNGKIEDNKRKVASLRQSLLTTIFHVEAFRDITGHFTLGWSKYQEHARKQEVKRECETFYNQWLKSIENSLVGVSDIN